MALHTRDVTPEPKQQLLPIRLTGYRLLTIGMILAFGMPKAIQKVKGGELTDLDWVTGITLGISLWSLRSYATVDSLPRWSWFFHYDYSRDITGVCLLPTLSLIMYLTPTSWADATLSAVYFTWACFGIFGKVIMAMTVYLILICVPIFAPQLTAPAFTLGWYCEFEYVSMRFVFFFVYIPIVLLSIYGHCILAIHKNAEDQEERQLPPPIYSRDTIW